MQANRTPGIDESLFSPPRPMKAYPKDAIRKIAVLFTDIVGSTRYFKDRGDRAGREMLQRHQEIASTPIAEHGGMVVKILGDSVMAYFIDSEEALKAAIKIQQGFQKHNLRSSPENRIYVRIGIHFGEGIIEELDIYGNVVNLAAKIVPLAEGDQIFVSEDACRSLQGVRFEPVAESGGARELEGFRIFRVLWNESVRFDPTTHIIVYLKPIWNLGTSEFNELWNCMARGENTPWNPGVIRVEPLENGELVLIVKEIAFAIRSAEETTAFVAANLPGQTDQAGPLPLQVLIDSGPYLKADRLVLDDFDGRWEELIPGDIHISGSALRLIKNKGDLATDPPFHSDPPQAVYRMISTDRQPPLFLYAGALVHGDHFPCFYCGSRKHQTTDCPSKSIVHLTQVHKKLGYSPIHAINGLFLKYLADPDRVNLSNGKTTEAEPIRMAHFGFYELKSTIQLRFFMNLWDSYESSWEEVKTDAAGGDKGGGIWMALDLIRTSRLRKAESQLNTLMLEHPQDYKVYCTAGFLYIEQRLYSKAEYNFHQALAYAKTKPQRIFLLFLQSRLFELRENLPQAEEKLREILALYPSCADARYQRAVIKFKKGELKKGLAELTKLIDEQRDFFLKALIDPDLGPFGSMVYPRLMKHFEAAKQKADQALPKVEEDMARSKSLRADQDKPDAEISSLWDRIRQLHPSESYFGNLDIVRFANQISHRCLDAVTARKKVLKRQLSDLIQKHGRYFICARDYPYPMVSNSLHQQLLGMQEALQGLKRIIDQDRVEQFLEAATGIEKLAEKLEKIPGKLRRLETLWIAASFMSSFFKNSVIMQSVNLLIGGVLLPVVSHYAIILFPDLGGFGHDLWHYQKGFLTIGAVCGLVLAIFRQLKNIPTRSF